MADGVEPTQEDLDIARGGIMLQLRSLCPDADVKMLEPFIENQVQVIACERAYCRMLQNIAHKGFK